MKNKASLSSLYEKHLKKALTEGSMPYSKEERQAFLQELRGFTTLGENIYRQGNLPETIAKVQQMVELACQMNLSETQEWFDEVTVKRHNKRLVEAYKIFERTGKEMSALQQRLEAAYEDIAEVLNKYYDL